MRPGQMGDGSRARISNSESAVSGSRARMLASTAAKSFFWRELTGTGLAKVETAAKAKRVAKTRVNCIFAVVVERFV